jgi:hypothetical protein
MAGKEAGSVRAPQLVGMHGPGSIVNLERLSVMPTDPVRWRGFCKTISSPTFQQQIYAGELIDTASLATSGVEAIVFPRNFVCRKCGLIQRRTSATADEIRSGFRCSEDRSPLFPSRWVVYCPLGHIDDFNYGQFVHEGKPCSQDTRLRLGATVTTTFVSCGCGARKSIREAYPYVKRRSCSGSRPWIGRPEVDCTEHPKLSMKSASDIYFGAVRSAITIEPESNPLVRDVFAAMNEAVEAVRIDPNEALRYLKYQHRFAAEPSSLLIEAITEFMAARSNPGEYRDRRYQEFRALCAESGGPNDDLWVEKVDGHGLSSFGVERLYAVRKLREVRALVGFQRGAMPLDPAFDSVDGFMAPRSFSDGNERIYPAYENRGEGIFFQFDATRLKEWQVRPQVRQLADRFLLAESAWKQASGREGGVFRRALFVFAHSFAHLVMRELALTCGYSQSSLRERIFASQDDVDEPWAGVLIYTASSDADGSLGGLVAQALEGALQSTLERGVASLCVCSSDPICALQVPMGFRKLNASACHACLVLPETCCERNNTFLDRNTVVPGTVNDNTESLCLTTP